VGKLIANILALTFYCCTDCLVVSMFHTLLLHMKHTAIDT